ncbi:MAG: glycosyl transferase, partial [Henriciella sp.]|nr:glycosyl transferase [Henriciella sp.]
HFRRADLIAFGGWDAWNVTEDADLGIRIARLGGRTETINAPTLESAPETLSIWINQRSRWIKGFAQTWLVCMRAPVSLFFELGPLRWLSLQLTLGGAILSACLYGPMVLMIILGTLFPQIFDYTPVDLGLFVAGWTGCIVADCLAPAGWSVSRIIAVATRPFYWLLLTAAAAKAVVGLALRPSYWAKTPHMPSA